MYRLDYDIEIKISIEGTTNVPIVKITGENNLELDALFFQGHAIRVNKSLEGFKYLYGNSRYSPEDDKAIEFVFIDARKLRKKIEDAVRKHSDIDYEVICVVRDFDSELQKLAKMLELKSVNYTKKFVL